QRLSLKEHHHNGDALLGTQLVVLGRHGNTLHEVLHLLLETALGATVLAQQWLEKLRKGN
ncbi:hypothetical protein TU85_22630, partial [Pseudomonas helleri]|uniref:hypothetical protein n=1 Tax=Pseudomonas helleri TaxID=1608996 RepID=UPI0006528897